MGWDDITYVKAPPEDVVKLGPARDQAYLVVLAGSGDDPQGKFGAGSLTATMLDEGAGTRSALGCSEPRR